MMDISTGLFVIVIGYCVLYFFDTFFKTCAHYPYLQFLKGTGFEIKFLQIRWITTAFNRMLVRWGSSYTKFFNPWFTTGLYITLALFPVAILLLFIAFVQNFIKNDAGQIQTVLEPLVPGINLPASELGYYSLTLVMCTIFHEVGHALAAVKEDVHIVNVGVNLFFILPVAYINLSTDKLNALHQWKVLRILCAGIWHNLVLSLLAYLVYYCVPHFFSFAFYTNNGISVANVLRNSPLYGFRGLNIGDTVIMVNDRNITDDLSWYTYLETMPLNKPSFCIDADSVHNLDESIPLRHTENGGYDCCGVEKGDHLCFEYLDNNNGIMELPPHTCLPVRTIIERSPQFCSGSTKDCANNLHCIRPVLFNNSNLFKIKRFDKADVVYIGLASDMLRTVQVSPYVPKHLFSSTALPDIITKFLKYVITFSTGFALVNVIPCIFMDGQHITNSLMVIIFGGHSSCQNVYLVSTIISLCGTIMLVVHCIINAYMLIS